MCVIWTDVFFTDGLSLPAAFFDLLPAAVLFELLLLSFDLAAVFLLLFAAAFFSCPLDAVFFSKGFSAPLPEAAFSTSRVVLTT